MRPRPMQTSGAAATALRRLCDGAARRSEIETPDSWMMHGGSGCRQEAIEALQSDRVIGPHVQKDQFLHVAGIAGGGGLELLDPWLSGLLHRVLIDPHLERSQWDAEISRFLDVLRVEGGTVPCAIHAALAGFALQDAGFELQGDAVVRPASETDFLVPIGEDAPDGVVFEYRVQLPASAGPVGFTFSDGVVAEVETAHQIRLTRFLLAMALMTEAPVQERLVMGRVDFAGGGSGRTPDEAGPIAGDYQYRLDELRITRVADCYGILAGKDLSRVGVATRRYLLARTERVRPADQIIDYAIALESMTSKRSGDKQGPELAKRITQNSGERRVIESEHIQFRGARESIVHDGLIPRDAKGIAEMGRNLVRRSLEAMAGLFLGV